MKKTRKLLDRMLNAETPLKSRLFQLLSTIALELIDKDKR